MKLGRGRSGDDDLKRSSRGERQEKGRESGLVDGAGEETERAMYRTEEEYSAGLWVVR